MFTMHDLLDIAVKMEKNGEAVYRDAIEKIKNHDLKSLLEWMAKEEASHKKWFADKKDNLSLQTEESNLKEMVPDVLQEMMGNKTLGLDDINFKTIKTIQQLLETFVGFETDTIQFYEMLELFIEDENVSRGLNRIIHEEKNHVRKIREMMVRIPEESI